mmetsp:Transcript_1444/g.2719  ORF Transcript_1444/g.2719 Transcript_1444/m.2719 type:complete len:350 (+) Transcript_1444:657-1706(+)
MLLPFQWVRAHAEKAILALKHDVDPFGEVVRSERGHANTKVHVHAMLQLQSRSTNYFFSPSQRALGFLCVGLANGDSLDLLLDIHLDDGVYVHTREMDILRLQLPNINNLLYFRNSELSGHSTLRVEVPCSAIEIEISVGVGFGSLDKPYIPGDSMLHNVSPPVELPGLSGFRGDLDTLSAILVLNGEAAVHDHRSVSCWCEKCGDAGTASPQPLSKGTLRSELHLKLAGEVLAFELGVFAHVRRYHALDLLRLQKNTKAPFVHAAVIRDHGEGVDVCFVERLDASHRDSAKSESPDKNLIATCNSRSFQGLLRRSHHLPVGASPAEIPRVGSEKCATPCLEEKAMHFF